MAKVYIGVGHGGKDSGAVKYLVEKDINLQMALACRDYLKAAGVETKISREDDRDCTINKKTSEANSWGADYALDIHNNAGGGDGFEVIHSINGGKGKTLAENIEKEVIKIGQNSRGLKTRKGSHGDYFGFIRQTSMPAIICEGVFVDNEKDAAQADTPEKCKAFGEAYARGILATLGVVDITTTQKIQAAAQTTKTTTQTQSKTDAAKQVAGYLVRVTANALNIRKNAGTANAATGIIRDKGVYTIVEEKTVNGTKWGKLKSGAGWICLTYTKKA